MNISVPDRDIFVLNFTKIPEKSEKSRFFVQGKNFQLLKNDWFFPKTSPKKAKW